MSGEITLQAVGDIMTGPSREWLYRCVPKEQTNAYVVSQMPDRLIDDDVVETLTASDVLFGNIEAVISNEFYKPDSDTPQGRTCPPETIELLTRCGFDVVNLANNHILDHGEQPVVETKDRLRSAGIEYIGDPLSSEEPVSITKKGTELHFAGFNLCAEGQTADLDDVYRMADDLSGRAGHAVLSLHWGWGYEHSLEPSPQQIDIGHELLDRGVDVVLGHHSHTFQPVERDERGVICYSLGNFIFDMWQKHNAESGIVEVTLQRDQPPAVTISPTKNVDGRIKSAAIPRIDRSITSTIESERSLEEYEQQVADVQDQYKISVFKQYLKNVHRFPPGYTISKLKRWGKMYFS